MAMKKRSTVMGGIKEYLEQCPAINTYVETLGREVNVNYLDEPEKSYSISQEPNEPWVKICRRYRHQAGYSDIRQPGGLWPCRD